MRAQVMHQAEQIEELYDQVRPWATGHFVIFVGPWCRWASSVAHAWHVSRSIAGGLLLFTPWMARGGQRVH